MFDDPMKMFVVVGAGRVVLVEVAVVLAPGVRAAHEGLVAPPLRLERHLVVLRVGAVELGDHVGRAAADLRELGGEVGDVELARNPRRRLEGAGARCCWCPPRSGWPCGSARRARAGPARRRAGARCPTRYSLIVRGVRSGTNSLPDEEPDRHRRERDAVRVEVHVHERADRGCGPTRRRAAASWPPGCSARSSRRPCPCRCRPRSRRAAAGTSC